jgi:hypothetical protein
MMDDANINNEEDQRQQAEQERIAAAAAAAAARRRRLKLISVLEGFDEIPFQTRNRTDELVEEFLENLEDDVHDMLSGSSINSDNYRGLDSNRDTEEEVETIVRFFPEVLSRRKEIQVAVDDEENLWFFLIQFNYSHSNTVTKWGLCAV